MKRPVNRTAGTTGSSLRPPRQEDNGFYRWPPAPAGLEFQLVKRSIDIGISLLAVCFILSWMLPLLCLLVLLDIGTPVFFVQERIGRHDRRFCCYKLRTMRMKGGGSTQDMTRLGKFMRYRKLDEVPQFFNVLRGEMSIVGPRPHMIDDHRIFSQLVGDAYHLRHAVRPGITGLAQVSGVEGPVTSLEKLQGRIRLDLHYVRHWSAGLEWWIIMRTVWLMLGGRNHS